MQTLAYLGCAILSTRILGPSEGPTVLLPHPTRDSFFYQIRKSQVFTKKEQKVVKRTSDKRLGQRTRQKEAP